MVLQDRFRVSQRRDCWLAGQNRNTQRQPVPVTDIEEQRLRRRIRELARRHVRWARRLVYRRLRLEGWTLNHKWMNGSVGRRGCSGLLLGSESGHGPRTAR